MHKTFLGIRMVIITSLFTPLLFMAMEDQEDAHDRYVQAIEALDAGRVEQLLRSNVPVTAFAAKKYTMQRAQYIRWNADLIAQESRKSERGYGQTIDQLHGHVRTLRVIGHLFTTLYLEKNGEKPVKMHHSDWEDFRKAACSLEHSDGK